MQIYKDRKGKESRQLSRTDVLIGDVLALEHLLETKQP